MTTKNALLRVMRSHCSECMGGPRAGEKVWPIPNPGDVEGCSAPECGLYPYRRGEDPTPHPGMIERGKNFKRGK